MLILASAAALNGVNSLLDRASDGLDYARAQNAALMVRAAYDQALEQVDVLVMPRSPLGRPSCRPLTRTSQPA